MLGPRLRPSAVAASYPWGRDSIAQPGSCARAALCSALACSRLSDICQGRRCQRPLSCNRQWLRTNANDNPTTTSSFFHVKALRCHGGRSNSRSALRERFPLRAEGAGLGFQRGILHASLGQSSQRINLNSQQPTPNSQRPNGEFSSLDVGRWGLGVRILTYSETKSRVSGTVTDRLDPLHPLQ